MMIKLQRYPDGWLLVIEHQYNKGACMQLVPTGRALRVISEHMLEEGINHGDGNSLADKLVELLLCHP